MFEMFVKKINKNKSAFSLIEVLIVVFIMSAIFTSFYSASTVGTKYIIESKNRLGAVAFANEKMEIIRNLQYPDIGIQGGIPDGKITQDEDMVANGRSYHVHTYIQYVDDELDDIFPTDIIPNDYKVAKVSVSWSDSNGQNQEVVSISRFVPPGLETEDGGAPLAINVKGSDGMAVKQALIHIVNNDVNPALNFTVQTDDEGHYMVPAAPESLGGYHITVSKNNYETVATLDSPSLDHLSQSYTPTYAHGNVLLNTLNAYDYIQDKLAKLTIKTSDYQNNPVGNFSFTVDGGKVLGRDALNDNVLNMHEADATDAITGQKEYPGISPGNYNVVIAPNAQYEFVEYLPAASPIALIPESDFVYELKVADKDTNAILVNVVDNDTSLPVTSAEITLKDSLDAEVFSNKIVSANGIYYYPDGSTPLPAGNYTLKVEAVDYVMQEIPVVINDLTKQEVSLIKS